MPSCQLTDEWKPRSLSLPTSRMSGGTLASVCSKLTGLSMSSPMSPHHSSTLTISSPPQLTTFAGVVAPPEDVVTRLVTRVEFFALDSTSLDRNQLQWLDERLEKSAARWKIVFMHHPLYTSGRYRNTARIHRWMLEPILVKHGVDAFFSGHEHIYQRSALENGVQYFVSGGAGSLRAGDGAPASYIARTYDRDYHFMLVEIDDEALYFQAISRAGRTIDAGVLSRNGAATTTRDTTGLP